MPVADHLSGTDSRLIPDNYNKWTQKKLFLALYLPKKLYLCRIIARNDALMGKAQAKLE